RREWPKESPGKVSGPPELERADQSDKDVEDECGRSDESRGESAKRHHRDIARRAGMAHRGIKKRDECDPGDKQKQVSRIQSHRGFISERLCRFKERRSPDRRFMGCAVWNPPLLGFAEAKR